MDKNARVQKTVRIPITNHFAEGDYTGVFYVGKNARAVNLLLDTGSSTPVIRNIIQDLEGFTTTTFADSLAYGSDREGFTGPVIQTNLATGDKGSQVNLNNVYITVIPPNAGNPFRQADGILGLAYKTLNKRLDTYHDLGINTVDYLLGGKGQPTQHKRVELPTYFTELESQGIVPNRFSFYTLRSVPHWGTGNPKTDPLNQGYFILGGGEEATDLYDGEFTTVKVVNDIYYNTNMSALYVGNIRIGIPKYSRQPSNSIVDSGTNRIVLNPGIYNKVVAAFGKIDESFAEAIKNKRVKSLQGWPDVTVELEGESGDVKLTLSPETYWQLNAKHGDAVFVIASLESPKVILGLPLMNNYYTIFDRSANEGIGVIKFAPIKPPN
ncbi:MAG: A1 family peptidase [Oscillatoria sp. SIO1A7]|nr:A1 family peptidase [Oscillatoria sp. SIO1A7]